LKCVLIADSHVPVRQMVRKQFEDHSWTVCGEASNAQETIDLAHAHNPHIVVLDLSMHATHSLDTGRTLKKLLPKIHLILFSISADLWKHEELSEAGFSAAISKTSGHLLVGKAEELFASIAAA
jgi:DNA-binding NarL/FixJ family response regulator